MLPGCPVLAEALAEIDVGSAIGELPKWVSQTSIQVDSDRELARLKLEKPTISTFWSAGEIGRQLDNEFGQDKLGSVNFQGVPADEAQHGCDGLRRLDAARTAQE
jgi:hypothetical protein